MEHLILEPESPYATTNNVVLIHKKYSDLTKKIKKRLLELMLVDGCMVHELGLWGSARDDLHSNEYVLAFVDQKIVGWGLSTPKRSTELMVFVDEQYRRRGIGSRVLNYLIDIATKVTSDWVVIPYDFSSESFFKYNGVSSSNVDFINFMSCSNCQEIWDSGAILSELQEVAA